LFQVVGGYIRARVTSVTGGVINVRRALQVRGK